MSVVDRCIESEGELAEGIVIVDVKEISQILNLATAQDNISRDQLHQILLAIFDPSICIAG
jgi:hypothetical protein